MPKAASGISILAAFLLALIFSAPLSLAVDIQPFLQKNCLDCHDSESKKGGLDLTSLKFDPTSAQNFALWVNLHDRVAAGEMPPKKSPRPEAGALKIFTQSLSDSLIAAEKAQTAAQGRSTQRRLNRYEYENAVRDLLHAPWLQLKDALPEDREAFRFNTIGDALDVSHVQMARYLSTADFALRQVMATQVDRPAGGTTRYYARDQHSFTGPMTFTVFNNAPERATFPVLGGEAQPDVRAGKAPITAGPDKPEIRDEEGVGMVASTYEPLEPRFEKFKAPAAGRYKLRFNAFSVWVGPGKEKHWATPDLDNVSKGRRPEPITIYSETQPRLLRWLGTFDVTPEPSVQELDVYLLEGETIRPDAARFFRSRPPGWHNPLAEKDGCPGVVYRWMEVEGPIYDQWPTAGHRLLFGDLPLKKAAGGGVEVIAKEPHRDAERLLRGFMQQAYRAPVADADVARFLKVIDGAMASGSNFTDAMIAGYTGVLCSPNFICLEERPGKLTDMALASRLSFFLWNSSPDDELRNLAAQGELHKPAVLRAQTDRLLNDPRSQQFVDAFLDYWLDLRKLTATAPDGEIYPEYYLDDLLAESALGETQSFFAELIRGNLPARNLVDSDFAMLNERLATHYGLPPVEGVAIRKVALPADNVRGGLLTQASVLKVTANGTTTSPVLRGAWVMERMLGKPPPPPPPDVPAIEVDTRGATTIRQLLDKHRTQATCAACHAKIDPAGFALENFDVMGGWRDHYRAIDGKGQPTKGFGHNGQKFTFHDGPVVDASGQMPEGGKFHDIKELKALLAADDQQVARNLARQLVVYSTGAPVRFGDREAIEQILNKTAGGRYGVRSLIEEIVGSELFLSK